MKKLTLILSVFFVILGSNISAQVDQVYLENNARNEVYDNPTHVQRPVANRKAKRARKAQKRHLKSMRRVAKADGVITPAERRVIKQEKRRIKRQNRAVRDRRS